MSESTRSRYFVVQPYGRDKAREATVVYEARTAEEAFAEIDRMVKQMKRTGVRPDSVEFLVVDEEGRIAKRRGN